MSDIITFLRGVYAQRCPLHPATQACDTWRETVRLNVSVTLLHREEGRKFPGQGRCGDFHNSRTNALWSPSAQSYCTVSPQSLKNIVGLPWWRSGWESACQCRVHGFEPWSGRIPHAAEQLGPWATTTEPACLEPVLRNKRGRDSERPAHRDEEWHPLAATRESPRTETKTQHSQK